jgi:hypothetical protein
VLILNTLPLAVALSLDDVPSHYTAGYFNVLARRLAGTWLDYGFQVLAHTLTPQQALHPTPLSRTRHLQPSARALAGMRLAETRLDDGFEAR